jgi:hypothetical protein
MVLGAAALLGLALSTPVRAPAAKVAGPAQPGVAPCTRYGALAEENDLVLAGDVAAWATAALERAALLDPASPCFVHVRITAGPLRTGGKVDGFVAHVSASTRRYLRDGKLVTREKGLLVVEPRAADVAPRVHAFVDAFVASLATTSAAGAAPAVAPGHGPASSSSHGG